MNDAQATIERLIAQGIAAQNAQRFGEAERAYRSALQIDQSNPQALALLGTLAGIAGRFQMAIDLFLRALQRDAENADLYHNLGETYRQLGATGKALPAFNRAIELRPNHLEAYRSAADTAIAAAGSATTSGHTENATELRRMAARYLLDLGRKQYAQDPVRAEQTLREAATLDPLNNDVSYVLGSILQAANRPSEAIPLLRRAIELNPRDEQAYNNLGHAYFSLQRWAEMEAAFQTAFAIDPSFTLAQRNLDSTALMRWLYDESATPQDIYERHRAWGKSVATNLGPLHADTTPFANSPDPQRKLRIAYLSGDFREHSVAYFFHPLLAHHSTEEFEVFCYSEVERPDGITEKLRRHPATWRDTTRLDDGALRRQLRADEIDVVIDLAGHTVGNRLRALSIRSAPVTVTWLGYPATTGLSTIDWRITDAIADPPGAEGFYTEKLLRLDEGFLCYQPLGEAIPSVSPLPALSRGVLTFGCFNAPQKISPSAIGAWASILAATPPSRLLLKGPAVGDPGLQRQFLAQFAREGITSERIIFRGYVPTSASHLAMYHEVDIALDPFPYNGTTTSCEAMWMGVPMISLIGDRHTGRVGLDLLTRIGLPGLAAPTIETYVATAVALAQDLPRLDELRQTLRDRMRHSSLCDAPRFARAFEAALGQIWQAWCRA